MDMRRLVEALVEDEERVEFDKADSLLASYLRSYPDFLRYFRHVPVIEAHHVIIAANFTYGWMPRMLRFGAADPGRAADILNRARAEGEIGGAEIECLVTLIDNSVIAVSKLLHFVGPARFCIWDSRVFRYIRTKLPGYCQPVSSVKNYLRYLDDCRSAATDPAFAPAASSIGRKLGYDVTAVRAAELIMFLTAPSLTPSAPPTAAKTS